MTLALLGWLLLVTVEIYRNNNIIETHHKRPVYWESTVIRLFIGFGYWVATPYFTNDINYYQWWGMAIMMAMSFWFVFDYGLNMVRHKPFHYLNPNGSFLDKLQCKYPDTLPWFFWKLFLVIASLLLYYYGIDVAWKIRIWK